VSATANNQSSFSYRRLWRAALLCAVLAFTYAAMLGKLTIVQAILNDDPQARNRLGPHGIPLMAHAQAGGAGAAEVVRFLETL